MNEIKETESNRTGHHEWRMNEMGREGAGKERHESISLNQSMKFDWKWNDECVNDRREPLNSINPASFN